jgi:APA family basic amino acid/polyamine antiporter
VWMSASPDPAAGSLANIPAMLIVLGIMILLVVGVRESARFNAAMVAVKLVAVAFFIFVGFSYVKPENWSPFMPYGFSGVMTGAAVVFFAYIGFDAVSTTAEEAKNPSRDLPIGIIASLIICTLLYLIVAGILTGIVPVVQYKADQQFLNAPVGYALAVINKDWAAGLVSAGAVAGITSVLLVMLMSQPRIFFAMSRDQLLPAGVSRVHPRFRTPYITTIITCVIVAAVAGFVPINVLGEMTSIGTLFAFVVVSVAVVVLRIRRPEARRPFRVPGGHVIPILGVLACVYLMVSLSVMTWVRFLGWLDIGMIIYWFYGRTHSPLVNKAEAAARSGAENLANFLKMLGYMLLFNGFCITLLAYLTIWNVTNETLAKWSELDAVLAHIGGHVNPEIADALGWKILFVGVAVTAVGYLLGRSSGKR